MQGAQGKELSPRRRRAEIVLHQAAEKLALHEKVRAAVPVSGSSLVSEALDRIDEALRRSIAPRHPIAPSAREIPPLFRKRSPSTPEEAYARIQEILDLRTRDPSQDEVYTIPSDQLQFEGLFKAVGPSLVAGDYPVRFDYYYRERGKRRKPLYGPKAKKQRDMPFVSSTLYTEMYRCLRLFPGYRKTCPEAGGVLKQPLKVICDKLLRGKITVDQVRFKPVSAEGKARLDRERALSELASEPRAPSQASLSRLAISLLQKGRSPAAMVQALRAKGATDNQIRSALHAAQQQLKSR